MMKWIRQMVWEGRNCHIPIASNCCLLSFRTKLPVHILVFHFFILYLVELLILYVLEDRSSWINCTMDERFIISHSAGNSFKRKWWSWRCRKDVYSSMCTCPILFRMFCQLDQRKAVETTIDLKNVNHDFPVLPFQNPLRHRLLRPAHRNPKP